VVKKTLYLLKSIRSIATILRSGGCFSAGTLRGFVSGFGLKILNYGILCALQKGKQGESLGYHIDRTEGKNILIVIRMRPGET
jgi:hypothetical protein